MSYDETQEQNLKQINISTRDSIEYLAVQILIAQNDLKTIDIEDYPNLMSDLKEIIKELQLAYSRIF